MSADLPVVPAPWHAERPGGQPFRLRPATRIVVDPTAPPGAAAPPDAGRLLAAERLADGLARRCGRRLPVSAGAGRATGDVVVRRAAGPADLGLPPEVPADRHREAYRLEVTAERVVVTALTPTGLVRAAATLEQLCTPEATLPAATVVDVPRFAWRGLSLDVARHPVAPDVLVTVLDVMAGLKLNVLHLHLSDDQGWRLDVPSRPELTARSGGTAVGGDPGGFYTRRQYEELVASAAARGITVVPEIDVPGHVNAALHACGELNPSGEPAPAYTGTGVGFSRLHADLPATEPFLRDVLGDVARMTPGPYVHIGGDEALALGTAEYVHLVTTAAGVVQAAGRTVVGWQEIATAPLAPGTVVQYWDERDGAEAVTAAAAAGALVLLSPATKAYLDMKYDADTPLGLDWAGHVELRDAYDWEPLDVLPGVDAGRVVGVEACLWTETVRDAGDLFLLLLPRLAAIAEVSWSAPQRRGWQGFAERVPALADTWDRAGLSWYRSPQVAWGGERSSRS